MPRFADSQNVLGPQPTVGPANDIDAPPARDVSLDVDWSSTASASAFTKRMIGVALSVIGALAIADILWLPHSTVVVDLGNYPELVKIFAILIGFYALGKGIAFRLRHDVSRIGRHISQAAVGLAILAKAAGLFIPLGFLGGVFMYVASAAGHPLMDGSLAKLDALVGFDWPSFLVIANASPWLSTVLVAAYHSVGPQIPLVYLILAFTGREERLMELIALMAIGSLLTAIGLALMPAAGAFAYFNPSPELFDNFTKNAGMWHYAELMRLRSGEPFFYLADQSTGLVTFPSYHTVLGIIITYALREMRWLFGPVALMNSVMVVSTLPEGGHHLVDILAGIVIALLSLAIVRMLERGAANATAQSGAPR